MLSLVTIVISTTSSSASSYTKPSKTQLKATAKVLSNKNSEQVPYQRNYIHQTRLSVNKTCWEAVNMEIRLFSCTARLADMKDLVGQSDVHNDLFLL